MKRPLSRFALCAGLLIGALGISAPASADLLFTINDSNCCGTGPFATVFLDDISVGEVDVTVTLTPPPPLGFASTGLTSFVFNNALPILQGDVSNLSSAFTWATSINGDGAGSFEFGFDCTVGCGNGGSQVVPGPLTFTLTHAGLTSASFTANASGNYFGVDICYNVTTDPNTGKTACAATGMTWTNDLPPPCTDCGPPPCTGDQCGDQNVPEPQPLALLGIATLALVMTRRLQGKPPR